MTTIPTDTAAAAGASTQREAVRGDWIRPRTTPDGDIMPGEDAPAGGSELGFGDLLDVINPLQHLPVVGTIYRALTGDTMSEAARMAGGALYGGPFGVVGALANVVLQRETGQDMGDTAMAWLSDGPDAGSGTETALADAGTGRPETAAQAINAAPVTIAAASASPAAQAATLAAGQAGAGTGSGADQGADRATTSFHGRSADRLDAFIQQANAVRRSNPLAAATASPVPAPSFPGAIGSRLQQPVSPRAGAVQQPVSLQAASLRAPGVEDPGVGDPARERDSVEGKRSNDTAAGPTLALAGGDAGSVNDWMLRALDKYEHMRRQEPS